MKKIRIVDSMMGTGKSTWAFNYMYEHIDEKFIYITPYLDEIERLLYKKDENGNILKDEEGNNIGTKWYNNRLFREPKNLGSSKLESLLELLRKDYSIATTHALFKIVNDDIMDLIKLKGYTLILDEAFDVIDLYKDISLSDYEMLVGFDKIRISPEKRVEWVDTEYVGELNKFNEFKAMCKNGIIYELKKMKKYPLLCWNFKIELFECFNEVYMMTYLFEASFLKYYLDMHDISFKKYCIEDDSIIEYENKKPYDKSKYKRLINIYKGNLNNIGDKKTALSVNWFKNNIEGRITLKNNLYNYLKNILKAKSGDIIWTTFQKYKIYLIGNGYRKSFVSCNLKATNNYKHCNVMAYCCNRYRSIDYIAYFDKFGIEIDQDIYALSEMLQWIWRSAIRNDNPIDIYIPTKRMRDLLEQWLNDDNV